MKQLQINQNIIFYYRRRNKLYKSLVSPQLENQHHINPKQIILAFYHLLKNKNNSISNISYFIKHQLNGLEKYSQKLIQMIWSLLEIRSGQIIAFTIYRICRKMPSIYFSILKFINLQLKKQSKKSINQAIVFIDLFLYGFSITVEQFLTKIVPLIKQHVALLSIKYYEIFNSKIFFTTKNQRIINNQIYQWIKQLRQQIIKKYIILFQQQKQIQNLIVNGQQNQQKFNNYQLKLENYQTQAYHFIEASMLYNIQFDEKKHKLKSIFQIKNDCKTFKKQFKMSQYQTQLYLSTIQLHQQQQSVKKNHINKIQQYDSFILKIKQCQNIQQCRQLSQYFIQQMNNQHNRQYLIQIIINDCCMYNNISYILKFLYQISLYQSNVKQYCNIKAQNIYQLKMNQKYQKLLCQMSKFKLINLNILLNYCQKILKTQNFQTTKQAQSILQNLGPMVYYRSLDIHIRINNIFKTIEEMIKTKTLHSSIKNLLQLKGLISYLQNYTSKQVKQNKNLFGQIKIKDNFQFIKQNMEKLLKNNEIQTIVNYIVQGVSDQEYLTTFYYADLLNLLKNKLLNQLIFSKTIQVIYENLKLQNYQKVVNWGRFLGQLYTYELINKKTLLQKLKDIVQTNLYSSHLNSSLQCICSALNTSKIYIIQSDKNRKNTHTITLFIFLIKSVCQRRQDITSSVFCNFNGILQYFYPSLAKILNNYQQIMKLIQIYQKLSQLKRLYDIYTVLDYLDQKQIIKNINISNEGVYVSRQTKYKQKQQHSPTKLYKQKKPRYIAKQQDIKQSDTKSSHHIQQQKVQVKLKTIKLIGKNITSKKIKTVSLNIQQPVNK